MAAALVLVTGLVGCGGGGGGDETPPADPMVPLTASNMDATARAVSVAPFGFGVSSTVVGAGGSSAMRSIVNTLGTPPDGRMKVQQAVARPLTVYTSGPVACPLGGTLRLSIDDRNENGDFDIGDVMIFDFDRCQQTAGVVTNGQVAVELLRVDSNGFGGRMVMSQLAEYTTDGRHSVTIDGTSAVDYAETPGGGDWLQSRAESPVTIAVAKHGPYTDTVTLQPGFWQESTLNAQGTTTTTFGGKFDSTAVGGRVSVSTPGAFVQQGADPYPRSGVALATGSRGRLTVATQSATQVRVGLDDNDCGVDEHSHGMGWDELF